MAGRRIFTAIEISDAARAACVRHIESVRRGHPKVRVGWERPEKLHITVRFLGDTSETDLEKVRVQMTGIAAMSGPFKLRLSSPGIFPSRRRPRIFWIGIDDPANAVGPIYQGIENVCRDLGYKHEFRDLTPHITIGRVRQTGVPPALADAHLSAQIEPVEFEVSSIVIYGSQLRPTGSVYSKLFSLRLGAA
jgi:RNA 2',3'-cyclic 3'-phosphodiesterase